MTDGYKPYRWQYQKSSRLDENLRKAAIIRDGCKCQECGRSNCVLEVHHIKARKYGGADTIGNLITLCSGCHQKTEGREREFEDRYFKIIGSKPKRFDYAMHVMQGKNYLRERISELGPLHLTNGGETANKRIEWNIVKSHSNDAICITDCIPDTCDVKEWIIKPMRRKSKAKTDNVLGIRHRDLVSYTYKNGEIHTGYVTALYPELLALNFQSKTKHCKKVNDNKISVDVRVSAKANNSITIEEDGLYVAVPDAYTKAETDAKIKKVQDQLDGHSKDAVVHITAEERNTWNAKVSQDELTAAKSEVISAAAADATKKADAARDTAKTYADGLNTAMDNRVKSVEGALTWKAIDDSGANAET